MDAPKVTEHIVQWLHNYATNAKMRGFVVGVSGGIDSAVTSTLCARTGLSTLCVALPIHQAKSQVNRANEHIRQLKERFENVCEAEVNLTSTFEEFKASVPEVNSSPNPKIEVTLANTRARLRMTTLYYFAGLHHLLVAGTGNKVEDFGVGFFTKYGDGGVDVSPIAALVKSEVYALGSYLKVPESIQKAQPTDGLFGDSRTDEDQIGASYDELEWAMTMQANGKTLNDFTGRKLEVYKTYIRLHQINQHKMIAIPVCEIPKELKD